jgi:hypothetical protein
MDVIMGLGQEEEVGNCNRIIESLKFAMEKLDFD